MAEQGVEMILGIKRDALFGPAILCGLGGLFVETLRDVAVAIPPVSRAQALRLIRELQGWPILAGSRGYQGADIEALSDVIVKFSHLAYSQRDRIVALDINPLMVYPEGKGVLAVDTLIQIQ
jgi:acyl-CoA synthetase (NDP forming)